MRNARTLLITVKAHLGICFLDVVVLVFVHYYFFFFLFNLNSKEQYGKLGEDAYTAFHTNRHAIAGLSIECCGGHK